MEKYSQNNEQDFILNYFGGNKGRFLEIGGYHPKVFSNTRALVELGWGGIYVEPSPNCFPAFEEEYPKKKFPNITLLNVAIGDHDGEIKFYDSKGDAISSTSLAHKEKWEAGYKVKYDEITVKLMSMNTLLSRNGKDIDFLNLDVESTNIELFNLIPDSFCQRLKMLCIEHDNQFNHIINRLTPFGFKEIHRNAENLIMVK